MPVVQSLALMICGHINKLPTCHVAVQGSAGGTGLNFAAVQRVRQLSRGSADVGVNGVDGLDLTRMSRHR
jgi:hypothetical protein